MEIEQFFQSLTSELEALKDRVRQLIDDRHWQTDGEWKESVIRHVLRRHLPASVEVGRGFVIAAESASHQIDILLSDSTKPVLFRDGDLAFVTPDAVLGIIEVKTRATPSAVSEAATKLAEDMLLVRRHPNSRAFCAFFAFEDAGGESGDYLRAVAEAAPRWECRLDFVCLGNSRFLRYWHFNPENTKRMYEGWRFYTLPNRAPGYFVHNVIDAISPESVFSNKDVWFPRESKEPRCDGEVLGSWRSAE